MTMRRSPGIRPIRRSGLGRLDVIVMMIVVAILCAVVAPAVYGPRITARKMHCVNNIRQVGLAIVAFTGASNGAFPPLSTEMDIENGEGQLGLLPSPWSIQILPALDAVALFKNIRKTAVADAGNADLPTMRVGDTEKIWLEVFTCPEDPDSFRQPGGLSYVVNAGFIPRDLYYGDPAGRHGLGLLSWDGNNNPGEEQDLRVSAATGAIWRTHPSIRYTLDDISSGDGTSSTLLLTENLQAGTWYDTDTTKIGFGLPVVANDSQIPFGEGTFFESATRPLNTGFKGGTLATAKPQDWQINADLKSKTGTRPRPGSNHKGGVNAFFCDGSARFLNESIDPQVYVKLLTSNGVTYGEYPMQSDF